MNISSFTTNGRSIAFAITLAGLVSAEQVATAQSVDLPPTAKGHASVESMELRTAVTVLQNQLQDEKARTAGVERKVAALAQSLAAANAEADSHRSSYQDLLLKLEGLGVDILDPDPKGLESRLLKAVRDRDLLERQLAAVTDQMFRMTEAFVSYMQTATSDDAVARQGIEQELLATEKVFQGGENAAASGKVLAIAEGRVVSLDPEIGLAVVNVGKASGVRVGMPLEFLRVDRPIGNALVVDVRDSICGVVISDLVAGDEDVKVGDRVRPRADTF